MGLNSWHKLNADAIDASGNGHNGTWSGTTTYAAGKIGQAASFNGNSHIDCGRYAPTGAFTYAFWIYPTASSGRPWSQCGQAAGDIYWYVGSGNVIYLWRWNDGSTTATFYRTVTTTIANNGWAHIAFTYAGSGSTLLVYKNGIVETVTGTSYVLAMSTQNLYLGRGSGGNYFVGLLDDFRVYDEVLPTWKIAAIYNFGWGTDELEPWQRLVQPTIIPITRKLILPKAA